jgi:hypothetical protein
LFEVIFLSKAQKSYFVLSVHRNVKPTAHIHPTAPHLTSKPTWHNLSLQCLVSFNLVAKVERFASAIPHKRSMASWLLSMVVDVVVMVVVAVAVVVTMVVA